MIPCTQLIHSVPEAAKQPQNIFEPPPYLTVGSVLFFVGLILFSVNSRMTCFAKKLYLSLLCQQNILPEELRLTQVSYCKLQCGFFYASVSDVGFSSVSCHSASSHSDDVVWFELTLLHPESAEQPEFVWKLSRLFIPHSNYPALHSSINFCLPSTSREVCHSSMGYKLLDYIVHS